MFDEAQPLLSIPRPSGGSPFLPIVNPARSQAPLGLFPYAPADDIANPLLNPGDEMGEPVVGLAHGSQQLTIFQPDCPPWCGPFPTLLFSTAGHFSQGLPTSDYTFLGAALQNGWCVVTVGGVGWNSAPTEAQIRRCTLNGGATNPAPCWDYNLWYPPDGVVSPPSPWNDFNYFYGEKDLVWARQWIAENAATHDIDNDRIVVSGESTGAIYASFVAYQPNRAWSGSSYSSQSKRDTRVKAYVAFDPVVWMEAIPNVPLPGTAQGLHWPKDQSPSAAGNVYRDRIPLLTAGIPPTQLSSLSTNGPSTYVRQFDPLVPTWIGAGDPTFAFFGRDAALVAPVDDYARNPSSVPPDDPTLSFPNDPATTVLHDLWNMLILKQDLLQAATAFHSRHSQVVLRDDTNWASIPGYLSTSILIPPEPPTSHFEVPLVDGIFPGAAGCIAPLPDNCLAIENQAASQKAVFWMSREVCRNNGLAVQCRNAGLNYSALTFTPAPIGGTATGKVYLCQCPDGPKGYDTAWIFGFDSPDNTTLSTGDVKLCRDGGGGELLGLPVKPKDANGVVTFQIAIPNNPALIGTVLHTQAWMYDNSGIYDDALTNAQDLVIQP